MDSIKPMQQNDRLTRTTKSSKHGLRVSRPGMTGNPSLQKRKSTSNTALLASKHLDIAAGIDN
jgi:lipopolysaccharide/colanic/teichoic acid biosynthesis glycosyltransferase